jgi:hypothetical protein
MLLLFCCIIQNLLWKKLNLAEFIFWPYKSISDLVHLLMISQLPQLMQFHSLLCLSAAGVFQLMKSPLRAKAHCESCILALMKLTA